MVAVKKVSTTRADRETVSQNTCADFKEAKPPFSFAGFIFVCSNGTIPDPKRGLFGLPLTQAPSVLAIREGMPLFLFNYSNRCLYGVFEAASNGDLNIDPSAWENFEVRRLGKLPVSRYPAQVRVHLKFQRPPLDEETFRPLLDHIDGHKFRLELTLHQVKQLLQLFSVPEREFFSNKSKNWVQSLGTVGFLPESPRSAFKLDSDCYSECSSKGTCHGEDEWQEDDRTGRESSPQHLPGEQHLCDGFSNLAVNDLQGDNFLESEEYPKESLVYDANVPHLQHLFPPGRGVMSNYQQSNPKRSIAKSPYYSAPDTADLIEASQLSSRFQEADPAVNSISQSPIQADIHHSENEDEIEALPARLSHLPAPYGGYENMICVPVHAFSRQYVSLPLPAKGSDKKLAGLQSLKQAHVSDSHEVLSSKVSKPYPRHPVCHQGLQYGPVFLPLCSARPEPMYEANQMTTLVSPVLLSSNGQGIALAHPQFGTLDSADDCEGYANHPSFHAYSYHNMLHNGQFPVLVLPSVIPRMPPGPRPMAEALHSSILQFARLTRPSAETQLFVESAIDCVRCCVRTVWPNSDVEVYGSFATGLCLQHSDVDLAVVNAPSLPALVNMTTSQASSFLLRELGLSLKASHYCESYNVIANASVPVLKCICRPIVKLSDPSLAVPSIDIDITIGGIENTSFEWKYALKGVNTNKLRSKQHTGGAAREYVLSKIRELPALAPLVFVMKSFLHHRGLSNVYLGGLGSFSLTLLLVYYLESQRVPLSDENFGATEDISSLKKSSASNFPDILEDLEVPVMAAPSLDEYYSRYKSECINWSLGQHFVRKAGGVIEKVLALWEAANVVYLGTLLLDFLRTFGFEHDLAREKIVLKGTDGSPGGIFKRENRHIALWIDDPLRPGVNIAAGSFGMGQVQAAFREMLRALTSGQILSIPLHCNEKVCQDLTAFRQLPYLRMLLVELSGQIGGFDN